MNHLKTHYQVLQVDPSAESEVVKAAYRRLADKYHPDKNKSPEAAARMAEINAAYAVLGDPLKRALYDDDLFPRPTTVRPKQENTMPYSAEISRTNPTLFVFLLDQSGSMKDQFGGKSAGVSKAQGVADAVNRMLSNLVIRCSQGEVTRNYFEVAVLGYGAQKGLVSLALGGSLAGREIVTVSDLGNMPARIEDRTVKQPDGAGGIIDVPVKFPIWLEPVAYGDTPMCQVLQHSHDLVQRWIAGHRSAFPPIVINLTDGEATDGNPASAAHALTSLRTDDGNVLLFNCHISSTAGSPILFPENDALVPDSFGKAMVAMSSPLTPTMLDYARKQGFVVGAGARGFVFQADLVDVIRFLDIGTRPADLR